MAEPSDDEASSAGSMEGHAEEADHFSLGAELARVGEAVNGAALLAEALAHEALSSEEAKNESPVAIGAILDLIHERLVQVGRAIRGAENPARLLTRFNTMPPLMEGEDPDLRLRPWTAAQRAAHHAREQAAAERDAERENPTPRREE